MTKKQRKQPGWWSLIFGVIFPAAVILLELVFKLCAEAFFDPIPTLLHKLIVFIVPLANLMLWLRLRKIHIGDTRLLGLLASVSLGVSGFYALIFLPLSPLAVIAILVYGMGLLPLAPLISFGINSNLYRRFRAAQEADSPSYLWHGIGLALLVLIALDIPGTATQLGMQWAAEHDSDVSRRGIKMLRLIGDEDILLRHCYVGTRQITGPLGIAMLLTQRKHIPESKSREIFYRVTGEHFNTRPVPYRGRQWARFGDLRFDTDQGGSRVGGRVKDLNLLSSRLDGSLSAEHGVAYMEWTFEFGNDSRRQQEARLQLALPPGAVVSRATLWIEGEEREAAFAGRGQARQAYQSIVRARRDPLLVTNAGPDRILAQAFPIAPNGGRIKFRLGITAPLGLQQQGNARLVLPAIVNRNFNINRSLRHAIWFESETPVSSSVRDIQLHRPDGKQHRLTAELTDAAMTFPRVTLSSVRDTTNSKWLSRFKGGATVKQVATEIPNQVPDALMLVVDGSKTTAAARGQIQDALKAIPVGTRVGLHIAGEHPVALPPQPWADIHRDRVLDHIAAAEFVGGQDNGEALANGILALEPYPNALLLWIHGPQPVRFSHSQAKLTQLMDRLHRFPRIALYSLQPGPNLLVEDPQWSLWAGNWPRLSTPDSDLAYYLKQTFSALPKLTMTLSVAGNNDTGAPGSTHMARLWALNMVNNLLRQDFSGHQKRAIALSVQYQLVTPVSGAVVLENAQQYERNNLQPVDANTVPTIPEARQWILALMILALLLWMLRRHSPSFNSTV
ncbi:hypothetical protein HBA55_17405 [Pseudomaricurvus alkylphenolicus]|uniref:VIT domain-containing protein n=1 Tax=Pseudomaricurvus alkylphenolicus TaxID=1306991 RepID=UPI0014203FF0|nr:VIT domain-containing protein [Pseudomaricurvus alkylphenolicus]NIB41384.1 hypothetical protein [Pseudomaricurvus alkylphenolicus]